MRRSTLYSLILILVILVVAIKYVPPVNRWARTNLPESVLSLIGERPKNVFEKSADMISEQIKKGANLVEDIADRVKTRK